MKSEDAEIQDSWWPMTQEDLQRDGAWPADRGEDPRELWRLATENTPAELHPALHEFLLAQFRDPFSAFRSEGIMVHAHFFEPLRTGLIPAVLQNLDHRDADAKDRRRQGLRDFTPLSAPVWPVISHVLSRPDLYANEQAWDWIRISLQYAAQVDAPRGEVIAVLLPYLQPESEACQRIQQLAMPSPENLDILYSHPAWDAPHRRLWWRQRCISEMQGHAALSMSLLAPGTPGLVEVLTRYLDRPWKAFWEPNEWGLRGGGFAAIALGRCGASAKSALPKLRELALQGWGEDCGAAFQAFERICEDPGEVEALLRELVEAKKIHALSGLILTMRTSNRADFASALSALLDDLVTKYALARLDFPGYPAAECLDILRNVYRRDDRASLAETFWSEPLLKIVHRFGGGIEGLWGENDAYRPADKNLLLDLDPPVSLPIGVKVDWARRSA